MTDTPKINAVELLKNIKITSSISPVSDKQSTIGHASQQESDKNLASQIIKDKEQRRQMRQDFEKKVFRLLTGQIIFLGVLILLQGFNFLGFKLDEWVFGLLVNGSLVYTYFIIRYIVSDLFTGDSALLKNNSSSK